MLALFVAAVFGYSMAASNAVKQDSGIVPEAEENSTETAAAASDDGENDNATDIAISCRTAGQPEVLR